MVWQRLLAFFSGADVYSATIVVAAFMSGLGCGSFAGGQVADRVNRVSSILLFAGAEVAVAAFGFFSRSLFYDGLYSRWGHVELGPTVTAYRERVRGIVAAHHTPATVRAQHESGTFNNPELNRALADEQLIERAVPGLGAGDPIELWVLFNEIEILMCFA